MKENSKCCALVKDLLPNYIDKLTSEETNAFVEKHLKECSECQKSYEKMSENINLEENYKNEKKVNIFKKINRKIKTLQAIILIVLIIFIGIFSKKVITLNKIGNLSKNTNYNNYYQKIVETTEKYINKIEYYQNSNNFIFLQTRISLDNEISKTVYYRYNGKEERYDEINDKKTIFEGPKVIEPLGQYSQFANTNLMQNISLALTSKSLQEVNLYKKNCYLLILDNYLNFIDKESGLTIKEINIANNSIADYTYSFNSVTDLQISKLIEQYIK